MKILLRKMYVLINEYNVYLYLFENWDYIIDKLTKERKNGNNVKDVL